MRRLPILTCLPFVASVVLWTEYGASSAPSAPASKGQRLATVSPARPAVQAIERARSGEATPAGETIFRRSLHHLMQSSLQAEVRQSGTILGQQIVADGDYAQLVADGRPFPVLQTRLRIDARYDEQSTRLMQLHTGEFLWTRDEIDQAVTLRRADTRRVANELHLTGQGNILSRATLSGGIPAILASLLRDYQLEPARENQIDGLPMWWINGTAASDSVPHSMPRRVETFFGRDDLFPYVIIYHHEAADDFPAGTLRTEYYHVALHRSVDPLTFQFAWDGKELFDDDTPNLLQSLK